MRRFTCTLAIVLAAMALNACGRTTGERAATGGAIGAAAGLGAAALTEADMLGAGLLGAGAGAAAGALTEPENVYLGEPVWEQF